ncbi:MAG: signal peptidase I [Clostridia bacterium]|nr:signal peptidase I [Clostridia bacterium]
MNAPKERTEKNASRHAKIAALDILMRIAIALFVVFLVFTTIFVPISVVGEGMSPMLQNGEIVLMSTISKHIATPKRGEAVVYEQDGKRWIGRIIACPGESIQVQNGNVYVNDQYLDEATYRLDDSVFDLEKQVIPQGAVFVMCDDRSEMDGMGIITYEEIQGIVRMRIYPLSRINFFGAQ